MVLMILVLIIYLAIAVQSVNDVYRMGLTWGLFLDKFIPSQPRGVGGLFLSFFNWYIPFFNTYSLVDLKNSLWFN
ncbi:hypothetical protein PCC7424_2253 [Gloeothece citriformis PCC 7424]|uniref:Uncharacterized protein n=1 Tax=Gloeothece citriformis (strain PCC 7424) TaxID=65393 RepID=B7KHI0_GLOC7|nr:hypothetical protein [Gloeothece citriformis]ACK70675.1 hypothetical protein PCC7424_2253 [Gloeothece citriformis PCC 7424]